MAETPRPESVSPEAERPSIRALARRVPIAFVAGNDKLNASKAWLDGFDTGAAEHAALIAEQLPMPEPVSLVTTYTAVHWAVMDEDARYTEYIRARDHITALLAERDVLREALQAILNEPFGCRFCDSGALRRPLEPSKGHDAACGYALAEAALARAEAPSHA